MNRPFAPETSRPGLEQLFVASLPDVEDAIRLVAGRWRLGTSEQEDFGSEVKLALIEDGYDALARFEGRSSLKTYLVVVIERLYLDRCRRLSGRWRPSAEAARLGAAAVMLETLIHRDHLPLSDAIEQVRRERGAETDEDALYTLASRLPPRQPRATETPTPPAGFEPRAPESDSPVASLQGRETIARCQAAIAATMAGFAPMDHLVLRLRFEDDVSVADIARLHALDQKALYRRLDKMMDELRAGLERHGVSWAEVKIMIERGQCHLRLSGAEADGAHRAPRLAAS